MLLQLSPNLRQKTSPRCRQPELAKPSSKTEIDKSPTTAISQASLKEDAPYGPLGTLGALPKEVRFLIYTEVLHNCCFFILCSDCCEIHREHWENMCIGLKSGVSKVCNQQDDCVFTTSLLRTSHVIYEEARRFLYSSNPFALSVLHCERQDRGINCEKWTKQFEKARVEKFNEKMNARGILKVLKFIATVLEQMGQHNTVYIQFVSIIIAPHAAASVLDNINPLFKRDWIQALQLAAPEILTAIAFEKCGKVLETLGTHLKGARLSGMSMKLAFAEKDHGTRYCHSECVRCWSDTFKLLLLGCKITKEFKKEIRAAGFFDRSKFKWGFLNIEAQFHSSLTSLFNAQKLSPSAKKIVREGVRAPLWSTIASYITTSSQSTRDADTGSEIFEGKRFKLRSDWAKRILAEETASEPSPHYVRFKLDGTCFKTNNKTSLLVLRRSGWADFGREVSCSSMTWHISWKKITKQEKGQRIPTTEIWGIVRNH